jgi:hypothetical protein
MEISTRKISDEEARNKNKDEYNATADAYD